MFGFELEFIFFLNLLLWAFVLLVPPVVVFSEYILTPKLNASGVSIFSFVVIKQGHFSEEILRHELRHHRQQQLFSPFGLAIVLLFHYGYLYFKHRNVLAVYRHSLIEKQANEAMKEEYPLPGMIVWDDKNGGIRYFKSSDSGLIPHLNSLNVITINTQ